MLSLGLESNREEAGRTMQVYSKKYQKGGDSSLAVSNDCADGMIVRSALLRFETK